MTPPHLPPTDVLLLGSTGAVLMPSNVNAGIASVASVTLEKLVVPLKVLNISDKELRLLREVVLFNPGMCGCSVCVCGCSVVWCSVWVCVGVVWCSVVWCGVACVHVHYSTTQ